MREGNAAVTEGLVEAGARAICALTGDDPDQKTYAHEMNCTGRDREPAFRWEYWAPFSRAVLTACRTQTLCSHQEGTEA